MAGHALNIVVDHNSDRRRYGFYTGRDYSADTRILYYVSQYKEIPDQEDDNIHKIFAMKAFDLMARSEWQLGFDYADVDFPKAQKTLDYLQKLVDSGILEEYSEVRDPGMPNWLMANRVLDILDVDEQTDTKEKEDGESKQEPGEGTEGDDDSTAPGDPES